MSRATEYERYMLELINAERAAVGAPPLQLELNLNQSADAHSDWMLREDIFSHTGVGGSSPTQRMHDADFDFSGSWRTAENIAVQSERGPSGMMDDVADLHTSLMNSPGHRANILNADLDYIGIGIALGDFDFTSGTYESVIVTQNFASTGGSVDLDVIEEVTPPPAPEEQQLAFVAPPPQEPSEPATTATANTPSEPEETIVPAAVVQQPVQDTDVPTPPYDFAESFGIDLLAIFGPAGVTAPGLQSTAFGPSDTAQAAVRELVDHVHDHFAFAALQLDDLAL